jgi:GT2 family glycosyltransferase
MPTDRLMPGNKLKSTKRERRKRAILVLGMHRSGTSALTRVLNLCGADLPKNLMQPIGGNNETGLSTDLQALQYKHQAVFDSVSWKATGPLRYAASLASELHDLIRLPLDILRLRRSGMFDADWYRTQYPYLAKGKDPLIHYLRRGARKGNDPNPLFDTSWYLERNPDVAQRGINPLVHFVLHGAAEGRDPNPLFHTSWYIAQNPDVANAGIVPLAHFLHSGAAEGRAPNVLFDTAWYVERNPEVAKSGTNPLAHYLQSGAAEGRDPHPLFDTSWYLEQNPDVAKAGVNPLVHYLLQGSREGRDPNPLFDTSWYLCRYPDVADAGVNSLAHYVLHGASQDRDPHPLFDTSWYLEQNPDVAEARINPLTHYLIEGASEGRDPSPFFDTDWYVEHNVDVRTSGVNPLVHYHLFGAAELRSPGPRIGARQYLVEKSSTDDASRRIMVNRLRNHVTTAQHLDEIMAFNKGEPESCPYFQPPTPSEPFETWQRLNTENVRWRGLVGDALRAMSNRTFFSVLMPVYDPPLDVLDEAIESTLKQTYDHFELILIDDKSSHREVRPRLAEWAQRDPRIRLVLREHNGHISAATNSGADVAQGEFLVFLDNDDKLHRDALALFALYLSENPPTDILYSDDAKLNANGDGLINPKFKPDSSPELLLSYCYISHLKAIRTSLYREIGGSRIGFEGSQDHDMLLRAYERARHIGHVPQVLYHRRVLATSTASSGNAKPYSFEAGRRAAEQAFRRRGVDCRVEHPDWAREAGVGIYVPVMPDAGSSVALLIPTRNARDLLDRLLKSLAKTTYADYRIYVIDNMSDEEDSIRYLERLDHAVFRIPNPDGSFNFAHINNEAAKRVTEDYVVFLNNDTEVINPRWLSQMVGWARLPGIGAVGARLLFPDGRVQHGGVVTDLRNGLTAFRGLPANKPGYLWYAKVSRNCAAVTAAAMLTPRRLFLDLGGFDEANFPIAYNDVDYCLRLRDAGFRIVYCGEAELAHHEGSSRSKGDKPSEIASLHRVLRGRRDPYYSPHLTRDGNKYEIKPVVVPPATRTTPLRVLAITHNLNNEGAPLSALELLTGLRRRGVIDPVVMSPRDGPLRDRYEAEGINVRVMSMPEPSHRIGDERDYESNMQRLLTEVHVSDFDMVYANTAVAFWAIDAAHRAGVPSIWNIRESESWQNYYDYLPASVAARALSCFKYPYRVMFVAHATLKRWKPLDQRGNFDFVHNGLDVDRFLRETALPERTDARNLLGVGADDVCVIEIGTICPRKGQHDLILAMQDLPDDVIERLHIVIVGRRDTPYNGALQLMIDELPLPHRAQLQVFDETSDTAVYWNAADVFVCTSRMESFPRVLLEAMAKSLPVITTPVFGIKEQVREGINGLFYEAGDVRSLVEHVSRLARDQDFRALLGRNSKMGLGTLTTYDDMLDAYAGVFRSAHVSAVDRLE